MAKSNAGISKNFQNQPAPAEVSIYMSNHGGSVSSNFQPDSNAPISKSAYITPNTNAVSKNFVEAEAAAAAASRAPKSQTLKVLQRPW